MAARATAYQIAEYRCPHRTDGTRRVVPLEAVQAAADAGRCRRLYEGGVLERPETRQRAPAGVQVRRTFVLIGEGSGVHRATRVHDEDRCLVRPTTGRSRLLAGWLCVGSRRDALVESGSQVCCASLGPKATTVGSGTPVRCGGVVQTSANATRPGSGGQGVRDGDARHA